MAKILVVEDNEMNRDMLCRRLQKAGYTICSAENGEEAVAKAVEEQPHLILMDMSMPVMDGWEATRRIKADEQTRGIPILALTAHATVDELQSTLDAGCDGYASKPIDFESLITKIQQYIE